MSATILAGTPVAARIRAGLAEEVAALQRSGKPPRVVAVHNADNPASRVYLRMQKNLCEKSGITYEIRPIGGKTPPAEVLRLVEELNRDPQVTGITLHLPLPEGVDPKPVVRAISPDKDIEATNPYNLAMQATEGHEPSPVAARGAVEILRSVEPSLRGLEAVVIGRSEMVGRAILDLLMRSKKDSPTVTLCHSATRDLAFHTRRADVLFAAVGKAGLVRGDMIKPGGTVIDIGINEAADGRIVGDVVFDEAKEVAGRITPVPGGVGPVALAVFLRNIVTCAKRLAGK